MPTKEEIKKDGPGILTFEETLELGTITEGKEGRPIVTFQMFGSYIEVEFLSHKDGIKPNVPNMRAARDCSDKQKKYVKAVATILVGLSKGWYPEKMADLD